MTDTYRFESIIMDNKIQCPNRNRKNWMVYQLFIRGDYKECVRKIEVNFRHKSNPFLKLVKALIIKKEGRVGESFEEMKLVFQQNKAGGELAIEIFKNMYLLQKYRMCLDNMATLGNTHDSWLWHYIQALCQVNLN